MLRATLYSSELKVIGVSLVYELLDCVPDFLILNIS